MGIEFLNPKGLWLLTAIVPLVVLYILKIKRERMQHSVDVALGGGAARFAREASVQEARRRSFRSSCSCSR